MREHRLQGLFNPKSIAVFGASESLTSVGGLVYDNLLGSAYAGVIHAINPRHSIVRGKTCYRSIFEVPEPVDLAVIASPAQSVAGILNDCGNKGIRNALIITAGFAETGEKGRAAQSELQDIAKRHDIRFIGPNCVGLARPWLGLNASFLKKDVPAGNIALVSQSGALCSAIADWAGPNDLGLSALISLGNSGDIGFGDALGFLTTDARTDAILLYVEGIRNSRSFVGELRAAARVKPVIVLKAGRYAKSSTAAKTHTGALIGSNDVFEAAIARAGAVQAQSFGQLFAAAEILSAHHRSGGNRLCIITNGGGAGVLASDRCEELGIELNAPGQGTIAALDAVLPTYWSRSNPVDILGDASERQYKAALTACLDDSAFDAVLVMLTPQAMTDADKVAQALVDIVKTKPRKPVLACFMGETSVAAARRLMSSSGIPDFTTPERAVEAFSYIARHEFNRKLAMATPGPPMFADNHDVTGARMIIDGALNDDRCVLSQTESKAVLKAFGIHTSIGIEADTATKAVVASETLGFPVAMKIDSPQITHKSDVGGVRTNIMSVGDVRQAFNEIVDGARQARPDAEIHGVTVEKMASRNYARELLVGVARDPVFGPTIVFGAGGTMVEVLSDSATGLPPLTSIHAEGMINQTRISRALDKFRNEPAADRSAIIEVLLRVSDMAIELPQLVSLDINPLFATPEGIIAVDARIEVERAAPDPDTDLHLAIAPYPRQLIEKSFLSDGTPITIRPIRPEDAESEKAFVKNLSREAKRFRFMESLKELTPDMVARFTQVDYAREMALVAILHDQNADVQHGVARYVINPDGRSCEFAIVVSDSVRNHGIGSKLMEALIRAARRHRLETMEGVVLSDNKPMLQLMKELAFSQQTCRDDPSLTLVVRNLDG
ncbi:MAG: bifunctional acetate--CoA ligase family protein/GNAT family N-acetyltransferase [Hyphomicrobiaceae bacterium]|nr:bifunctional acetate--CoA ligase family protein/GNAT family N-acetyltransferase [Hyphomicrobiaceae bacterium]MCC0009088.1 bifunctional acetate--CoA ligase family protein/GNAT family N-acetyltransferase [Hyphomicrobiaceae bacterium]